MFRKEAAVEGQELGDIHDRLAGEARRARRQEDIPGSVGKPVSRLGSTRLGTGPPTRSPLAESCSPLPGFLFERLLLGAVECGIDLCGAARIHVVQAFGDCISTLLFQKVRNRFGVQLASGNSKATGSCFRPTEEIIRQRDGGLHTESMTRVIPEPSRRFSVALYPTTSAG